MSAEQATQISWASAYSDYDYTSNTLLERDTLCGPWPTAVYLKLCGETSLRHYTTEAITQHYTTLLGTTLHRTMEW